MSAETFKKRQKETARREKHKQKIAASDGTQERQAERRKRLGRKVRRWVNRLLPNRRMSSL